jgi:hypothetical protein
MYAIRFYFAIRIHAKFKFSLNSKQFVESRKRFKKIRKGLNLASDLGPTNS